MSIEDNENIYIIEEEKEIDNSPMNFAAYNKEEEDVEEDFKERKSRKTTFALLFKIMFNPVEGWKSLRRSRNNIESLQGGCFYPILALLAVSHFAEFFYSVNATLSSVMTQAVVTFVAFFFSFFCIQLILSWVMPKELISAFDNTYGKEYILISLSTLALFSIITNILPMLWPILIFLPIWTLYIMFKGVRFFKLPEKYEMKFFVVSSASVIGMPLLIDWILNTILPY